MGICRILLSPCGFGLFSDICLLDCRPCRGTSFGPLRSAIRHLPLEMRWRSLPPGGVKIESWRRPAKITALRYQTRLAFSCTSGLPLAQPNALANSGIFATVLFTRYLGIE